MTGRDPASEQAGALAPGAPTARHGEADGPDTGDRSASTGGSAASTGGSAASTGGSAASTGGSAAQRAAVTYDYVTDGAEIYRRSFGTIRAEADLSALPADLAGVAVRMIHASGQTDLPAALAYSPGVVTSCRQALRAGAPVLCDSQMVASGIIRTRLPAANPVVCHLGDPALAALASELGTTKTAAAVELWRPQLDGAVVAIGNAPTALFHLLEVVRDTGLKPAGVLGLPVGFVGAAESKRALAENPFGLEYLVLHGRRGGSAITSAAVNAIASEAE